MALDSSPLARYQALPSGMGLPSRPKVLVLSRKQHAGAAKARSIPENRRGSCWSAFPRARQADSAHGGS
eukprot:9007253-Heterocapsa_arctica.AAC.1